ncbi:MAG: ferrous iron transport protein A [Acidobacteria bacterium]|nr:ferrous iron transport protein A [Acidobacteriota bacterium]MCB9399174.1 ferrous iron transport protein A [Acidobacteriota bacterium]
MTLDRLLPGQTAIITQLDRTDQQAIRLCEMGFIAGQTVTMIRKAPLGEPFKIRIMNYDLCIRKQEALAVHVEPLQTPVGAKTA